MSSSQRPLQPPENQQYPYGKSQPPRQIYPPQPPSKSGLSTGRIVAIVLGSIGVFLLLLLVGFGILVQSLTRDSPSAISQRGSEAITSSGPASEASATPSTSATPSMQSKNFSQVIYSEYDRRGIADGRPSLALQLSKTGIQHPEDSIADVKDTAQQPGVETLQIFTDAGSYISVDTQAAQNLPTPAWQALLENLHTEHPAEYSIEVDSTGHAVVKVGGADSLLYRDTVESEMEKIAQLAQMPQLSALQMNATYINEIEGNHLISVGYSDFSANLAMESSSMVKDLQASPFAAELAAVYFSQAENGEPQLLVQLNPQTDPQKYSQEQFEGLEEKIQEEIPQIHLKIAVKSTDPQTPATTIYEGK